MFDLSSSRVEKALNTDHLWHHILDNIFMRQQPEALKATNAEVTDTFSLSQAIVMIFLMIVFVGSTIYVLISSLID